MDRLFSSSLLCIIFILCVCSNVLFSLKRDDYGFDSANCLQHVCSHHLKEIQSRYNVAVYDEDVNDLLYLFPLTNIKCDGCNGSRCANKSIFKGYFDIFIDRYFYHLYSYLNYYANHSECKCYWPEISPLAAQINDLAYDFFGDILNSTVLNDLHRNGFCDCGDFFRPNVSEDIRGCDCSNHLERFFWQAPEPCFSESSIKASFVSHSFFYSDYLHICQDLNRYCQRNYNAKECEEIEDKLDDILDQLAPLFLKLYNFCLSQHPNEHIAKEKFIIESSLGFQSLFRT